MNPLTKEWVEKAEGDFNTTRRELHITVSPNYDAVCFHAQQTAEKYLKAVLQEKGYPIPRTHILADLLGLCINLDSSFHSLHFEINTLEGYAVQIRYPGFSADKEEARAAFASSATIRDYIRNYLDIK
jgi:HEPN domain-containing protein